MRYVRRLSLAVAACAIVAFGAFAFAQPQTAEAGGFSLHIGGCHRPYVSRYHCRPRVPICRPRYRPPCHYDYHYGGYGYGGSHCHYGY